MYTSPQIAFLGGGNMATAIITGMIKQGGFTPQQITVVQRSAEHRDHLQRTLGVIVFENIAALISAQPQFKPDIWVLAVKPQSMKAALTDLSPFVHSEQVVLSIAAGLSITSLSGWLNNHTKVVRTMPNTPSLIGKGVTGIYAPLTIVSENEQVLINQIFSAIGVSVWLNDEKSIDAVAAISGSGPAYVFYMMEHLTTAARELGFDDNSAKLLVQNTFSGAVALAETSKEPFDTLRERVTSKGGTTAAALAVFNEHGISSALIDGTKAAVKRAKELATELNQ